MEAARLGLALVSLFTLPGWALLAIGDQWRAWAPLQRWCLAICLSLALYPVLFYVARLVPGLTLGPLKLCVILAGCGVWAVWRLRGHWRDQLRFDWLEWLGIGLIALTLLTRFWIVRVEPYPAWTDSLHHTLLTTLTAAQGRLPINLDPYFPIPLDLYHLGLYAVSGSVQMLSGTPAHTALLWSAQALNGLCGLGVYLVLDRKAGRVGALAGLAVVGLLATMPAWYVNWGRFTQLAGQTLMLAAWLVTWEALAAWRTADQPGGRRGLWLRAIAALLTAATFLMHFRVAAFAAPLYLGVGLWELFRARRAGRVKPVLLTALWLGLAVGLLVLPVLLPALAVYLRPPAVTLPAPQAAQERSTYFDVPFSAALVLAGPAWLLALAALAGLVGFWRRNRLAWLSLGWVLGLMAMGSAHLLQVRVLAFTNLGAVLIMLYLPLGLLLGATTQEGVALATARGWGWAPAGAAGLLALAALLMVPTRLGALEPYRFFVTPADLPAMAWIRANTQPEALIATNTVFWLPRAPHGTDAGYWIPYLTGRRITSGAMLLNLAEPAYQDEIIALSQAEERLEGDVTALEELRRMGVEYVYIGARGDFSGAGLDGGRLTELAGVRVAYEAAGVTILSLDAAGGLAQPVPFAVASPAQK
jgi:hypothetical protein